MNLMRILFFGSLAECAPMEQGHCTICVYISLQTKNAKIFLVFQNEHFVEFVFIYFVDDVGGGNDDVLNVCLHSFQIILTQCVMSCVSLSLSFSSSALFFLFTFLFINGIIKCMDVASIMER